MLEEQRIYFHNAANLAFTDDSNSIEVNATAVIFRKIGRIENERNYRNRHQFRII